ncbi:hypothetical protein CC1G_11168 [Coprinopsis cinerea okayama7|uniref:Major facilitator superfamily (MFS) profile domain-containing protein n=1 Tax=Coprinopsis cinerea (strain Okayama-7 / 130 / ATCC MYA-4618 / FGSC 9003) TaxID=240176 RepID=A8P4D0_COPC7|nr:hypothetical protein CC1G_11168 [Coprinopsis cinerea okayama7\|eukprot:XP_001838725.2 hypothetical protein CC1G_11168 [Coprinopsis cinerea okayama7\
MQPVTSNHHREDSSEEDSLLPGPSRRPQRGQRKMDYSLAGLMGWKAHPYWLIPVVIIMSMSRGITMSPRVQVYNAIACRSISNESGIGLAELLNSPACDRPEVKARAVEIQASVITTMSVLSTITTGFWSRLGDKYGRTPILAAFFIGALLMEAVYVLVMKEDTIFGQSPERWILAGPIIEGLVGGLSVFNGVTHAYVSDCTRHGSRSKIFSTLSGMIFVGLAMGPWFSGYFLPKAGYSDSFFFCSISLISFNFFYVLILCPESLQRQPATTRTTGGTRTEAKAGALPTIRRLLTSFIEALLLPLFMFAPRRSRGTGKRSYTMVFMGLALLIYLTSTGVFSAKYVYATHEFKWNTAELGYYMSLLWTVRAFNLLVLLPIIISYFKPKPTDPTSNTPNARDIVAEVNFDRYLAQASVGLDGLADTLVAITASRSSPVFIALSCLSSFTSGGNPTLHSLGAIAFHACGFSSEVGALFGAMAVLSAIAHTISPTIYAFTYRHTVATYPEGIFALAACLLFSTVLLLNGVSFTESEVAQNHATEPSSASNYDYEAVSTTEVDNNVDEIGRRHERTMSTISNVSVPHHP